MMRIAYVTTDEVNRALATRMARPLGAAVSALPAELTRPKGRFDAVLYDLDRVPAELRPALLEEILRGTAGCPRAVHGYALSEEQADEIRLRGVGVAPRLHRDLVDTLCREAHRASVAVPAADTSTDLTWIDLAE